jgi:putative redox protein
MQAVVKWVDGVMFVGETGSGHAVVMDGAPDHGGRNLGARPMEMVLLGLGGCSSFDVVAMLKKARQPVVDCRVEITAERADAVPAVFTRIALHFVVTGPKALKLAQVERAVALSAEKYCSVSLMLGAGGVAISHTVEVVEAD